MPLFFMIEFRIAIIVASIAVSVPLLSPTQFSGVERFAPVKSHIYDVAYSYVKNA